MGIKHVLGRVLPYLLASTTTTDPAYAPDSLRALRDDMKEMYRDLVDDPPGGIYKEISPTLRFCYVSPPDRHGRSTWRRRDNDDTTNHIVETNIDSENKPIAVYLPGLDGTGISAFNYQFDDLARTFELWRLTIPTNDRSTFSQVIRGVVDFVHDVAEETQVVSAEEDDEEPNNKKGREVVLIGESFGGVLAAASVLALQKKNGDEKNNTRKLIKGLVLVNPATGFQETNWDTIVPLLSSLKYLNKDDDNNDSPTPYSLVGGLALSYLVPDSEQLQNVVQTVVGAVTSGNGDGSGLSLASLTDAQRDMFELLDLIEERLPADVLEHRVTRWLSEGTPVVNRRLSELGDLPVLVVAGDEDKIVPSGKEADRLVDVLGSDSCEKLVVRGKGHFVLDETVNLTEAILFSKIDPLDYATTKKKYDPVTDWNPPPPGDMDEVLHEGLVKNLKTAHSPVFFSTDAKGKRFGGLSRVQRINGNEPILFVANHQFAGLDLSLIIGELYEQRNIFARGLAHPMVFNGTKHLELMGRTPGLAPKKKKGNNGGGLNNFGNFQKFGAVPVTPRNYFRMLQTGQDSLLFPGGVKDVFETDPGYPLNWPSDSDFIRTAARFNATIIPISAVGMLDSLRVLVETKDIANIPFVGKRFAEVSRSMPAARMDERARGQTEPGAPIAFPGVPQRNYFVFGKPFSTRDLDSRDKRACEALYKDVVAETRRGLDDVLAARKFDPFGDTPKRVAYEQLTNKKAPTFPVDKLN